METKKQCAILKTEGRGNAFVNLVGLTFVVKKVWEKLLDVDQTLRQKWQTLRIPISSQSQWNESETDA